MHTLSSRTNMPRGVVVYADKRGDVASFPAFLNGNRMPVLADVVKLCGSVSIPVKAAPVVVAFKADDKAMTFTWYAGREMWSAQVETTTGGSTHWWMTPAEMHAWANGRGYSAQFAQAHAEAVEAASKPLSEQVRRISPAALESHPYVVIVDDIPCIFKTRGEAAQFATAQMHAPHVSRVESAHLRLSKDGKRFL